MRPRSTSLRRFSIGLTLTLLFVGAVTPIDAATPRQQRRAPKANATGPNPNGVAPRPSSGAATATPANSLVLAPKQPTVPFASAPNHLQLANDPTGGQPVVRDGSLAQFTAQNVTIGQRTLTIGALADQVLAPARQQHSQAVAARAALFSDPVLSETFKETSDATLFTLTSSYTVVDGTSAAIPSLRRFKPKSVRLNQLTAQQRRSFDSYKATLGSKPAGHPLRVASAQSDQAVLDAIGQGKVDVTHVVTVRVDKTPPPPTGKYALGASPVGQVPPQQSVSAVNLGPNKGTTSGTVDHTAKFLTGWTLADSVHWSERIDVGVAWVEVGLHAGYGLGLRVPVVLKGTMTPTKVERQLTGGPWGDQYDVTINDVQAIDGDVDHYKGTGLENEKIKDGKELVLEADAYAFAKGEVLGVPFNERFPQKPLLDEGRHMRPPYGNCGIECGLNFFFPCTLTKTCIDVLGIVKGGAQIGFNVGGSGTVSYDYESLVNGQVAASTRGASTAAALTHRVSTDGTGDVTARFHTPLPTETAGGTTFGYRLSNPSYAWTIALTPIVQADATFDYVIGEADLVLGPYPLPISITLGTITLPTHAGTQVQANKVDGLIQSNTAFAGGQKANDVSAAKSGQTVSLSSTTTTPAQRKKRKKDGTPVANPPVAASPASDPAPNPLPSVAVPGRRKANPRKASQSDPAVPSPSVVRRQRVRQT